MSNKKSNNECGVVDGPMMGYATNWDSLHQQVASSQTKCKLEYNKFREMSTKIQNNKSSEFDVKNTVWNSTNKKDVTKNNIENKCRYYTEMVSPSCNEEKNDNKKRQHSEKRRDQEFQLGEEAIKNTAQPSTEVGEMFTGSITRPSVNKCPTVNLQANSLENAWKNTLQETDKDKTKHANHNYNNSSTGQHLEKEVEILSSEKDIQEDLNMLQIQPRKNSKPNYKDDINRHELIITELNKVDASQKSAQLMLGRESQVSSSSLSKSTCNNSNYCNRCGETIYAKELMEPHKGVTFHEWCFRCDDCGLKLTLKTFVANQQDVTDSRVYCKNHAPQLTAGKLDHTAKQVSKVSSFNGQIRGPDAGKAAKYDTTAISIQTALNAPRPIQRPSHHPPPPDVVKSDVIGLRYF